MNVSAELEKLESELEYNRGFLNSVMKKLGNSNFVNNAPQKVVDIEQRKKADTEAKIMALVKRIEELGSQV
jgi:valyl-tRNA synthetase